MTGFDIEQWTSPEGIAEVIVETWTGGMLSPELFGAGISAALLLSMWFYSDDLALPTILAILLIGPFAFTTLPGDLQQVGSGIIAVGVAAAVFEAGRRYVA